jgi:hypothetical protein
MPVPIHSLKMANLDHWAESSLWSYSLCCHVKNARNWFMLFEVMYSSLYISVLCFKWEDSCLELWGFRKFKPSDTLWKCWWNQGSYRESQPKWKDQLDQKGQRRQNLHTANPLYVLVRYSHGSPYINISHRLSHCLLPCISLLISPTSLQRFCHSLIVQYNQGNHYRSLLRRVCMCSWLLWSFFK